MTTRTAIVAVTVLALTAPGAGAAPGGGVVRDGPARFEVLTPTLVRLEYSPNAQFEDRPTLTVANRDFARPAFTTRVEGSRVRLG